MFELKFIITIIIIIIIINSNNNNSNNNNNNTLHVSSFLPYPLRVLTVTSTKSRLT